MKINNKGYASTIIMFSILTLFLISMLMLVKTMNNSSSLNKKITDKVIDNIDYDASGSVQDRLSVLENKVSNLKSEVINEIYPVGSIYMSTEDDTIEKVQSKFGGTWEKYARGRTIIGEGTLTDSDGNAMVYTNGLTGGITNAKLSVSNIPSHSHSYTPSGTISSIFTGTQVDTGIQSANHTHSIPALSGYTSTTGAHTHNLPQLWAGNASGSRYYTIDGYPRSNSSGQYGIDTASSGEHSHTVTTYASTTGTNSVNHTHKVTAAGLVSSTFKGAGSNTETTGLGTAFSVQNPYIVMYIYKRVK